MALELTVVGDLLYYPRVNTKLVTFGLEGWPERMPLTNVSHFDRLQDETTLQLAECMCYPSFSLSRLEQSHHYRD